jgi:hypothetical protein
VAAATSTATAAAAAPEPFEASSMKRKASKACTAAAAPELSKLAIVLEKTLAFCLKASQVVEAAKSKQRDPAKSWKQLQQVVSSGLIKGSSRGSSESGWLDLVGKPVVVLPGRNHKIPREGVLLSLDADTASVTVDVLGILEKRYQKETFRYNEVEVKKSPGRKLPHDKFRLHWGSRQIMSRPAAKRTVHPDQQTLH